MNLHAEVDESICLSAGRCVADAPEAFRFDDDEIAQAIDGATALPPDRLRQIARACPSGAIRVFDGDDEVEVN